jgi:hypothetical protein
MLITEIEGSGNAEKQEELWRELHTNLDISGGYLWPRLGDDGVILPGEEINFWHEEPDYNLLMRMDPEVQERMRRGQQGDEHGDSSSAASSSQGRAGAGPGRARPEPEAAAPKAAPGNAEGIYVHAVDPEGIDANPQPREVWSGAR